MSSLDNEQLQQQECLFWGYPPLPHDYPYYWVILDAKSKEDKVKLTNLKNLPKFHIYEFWDKFKCDTPYEVAW